MPIRLVQCWRNTEEDIRDMLRIQKDIRTQLEAFGEQANSLGDTYQCGVRSTMKPSALSPIARRLSGDSGRLCHS
jgi:hypothetical protein